MPDLICTAKTLAGGMLSLAATLVSPEIVAAWDTPDRSQTFFHGHSFTAHPLACAVACENLDILKTQTVGWAEHRCATHQHANSACCGHSPATLPVAQRMESFWNPALAPLQKLPQVREVRCLGTVAAIELNVPGGYLADVGRRMRQICLEHGVMLRPLGNVLYAMPPFCTSGQSLEIIALAMTNAVQCTLG